MLWHSNQFNSLATEPHDGSLDNIGVDAKRRMAQRKENTLAFFLTKTEFYFPRTKEIRNQTNINVVLFLSRSLSLFFSFTSAQTANHFLPFPCLDHLPPSHSSVTLSINLFFGLSLFLLPVSSISNILFLIYQLSHLCTSNPSQPCLSKIGSKLLDLSFNAHKYKN